MSTLSSLVAELDKKTRDDAQRRREALQQSVRFELERRKEKALFVVQQGWTVERLDVVCELTAFNQAVLGPLTSTTVADPSCGLGTGTVVRFGSRGTVDSASRDRIRAVNVAFRRIVGGFGVRGAWLEAPTGEELLFRMWASLQ
jgi:hypothetical protein